MRRYTQRQLTLIAQLLIVAGLGLVAIWNVVSLLFHLPSLGWWGLALPVPGLCLWGVALAGPTILAKQGAHNLQSYRLVYDASPDWDDKTARAALLNLIRSGCSLEITWIRDGEGTGCWLSISEAYLDVLQRLVGDVFPEGHVEPDQPPTPGEGVVILHLKKDLQSIPAPSTLCQMEGIKGALFRWRDQKSGTVALWGPKAGEVAGSLAKMSDILPGQGETLKYPRFVGDNPWPDLPHFPSSKTNPGLAAISNFERLAPELRVNGTPALVMGHDSGDYRVGFSLPALNTLRTLQIYGAISDIAAVTLADQAIRAGVTTLFLDGEGMATTLLSRRLMREIAANKVLICDVERPAQSRFRFNPLWLPDPSYWPATFPDSWLDWLRELGVTPAGLGQNAYRHTVMATVLTATIAAKRNLTLDPAGLRDALQVPDFLTLVEGDLSPVVGLDLWKWWIEAGRGIPNFDVHLRLGHLRDRLSGLLEIPEYGVLWHTPYLDPLVLLENEVSLLWRLPDPRQRLQPYISSQLLGITTLLSMWPANRPVLIFLHEINGGLWIKRLRSLPMARVILVSQRITTPPILTKKSSLLLSRLDREGAEFMSQHLNIRAADLRRLPHRRLLFQQDQTVGTFDLIE